MRTPLIAALILYFVSANAPAWAQALPYEKNDKLFVVSTLLRNQATMDDFKMVQSIVHAKDKVDAVTKVRRDAGVDYKGYEVLKGIATDVTEQLEQNCAAHI